MNSPQLPTDLSKLRGIDSCADRFEAAWSSGDTPRLEEFLTHVPAEQRSQLLSELLAIELEWRSRRGHVIDVESYRARFAESTQIVDAVLTEWSQHASSPDATESAAQSIDSTLVPSDDSSAAPPVVDHVAGPSRIGRYRILRQLGAGAMGVVYLAEDEELHRRVALKVPKSEAGLDRDVIERFQREARAAATLNHPNVCAVYDIGAADGVHYITMAYIEGRPLQQILRGGRQQPERQAALLIRKLALGLQAAHEQGVIHRDLKPANVLLNKKHEPVIMDFGLALLTNRQEDARLTKSGVIVGSPAYMSPEQVSGDPNAVGPSSDIYSLGVIFYELLTGRLPFQGNVIAVIAQIQTATPQPVRTLRPEISPGLEAIVARMMERSPDRRYSSMQAVADDLALWLKGGQPGTALVSDELRTAVLPSDSTGAARRRAQSRRTLAWIWGAIASVVAVILLGVTFLLRTPEGDVRIEVLDERISVELDGNRITLTDKHWTGRKPAGKHRLAILVNGTPVPIGNSLPLELDGTRGRLVASLGGQELTASEFEVQRGGSAVIKLVLLAVEERTRPGVVDAATQADNPIPTRPIATFHERVEATATLQDEFNGADLLVDGPQHRVSLADGRLGFDLDTSDGGSVIRQLFNIEEGLFEIDVRTVTGDAGPRFKLSRIESDAQVHLWVEDGTLRLFARAPEYTSGPKVMSVKLPLRSDDRFDRWQLLFGDSTLEIALNGERIGPAIEFPFQLTPGGMLALGINKTSKQPARVEYDRVAFYPAKKIVGGQKQSDSNVRVADPGEELDLLALATLDQMYHLGPWEQTADGLYCGLHESLPARLELPVRPRGDYDLEITFTLHDENNLMMRLPVGGRPCEIWLSSYDGRTMAFHLVEQPGVVFPAQSGRTPSLVKLGQRHTATVRVREKPDGWRVETLIDGKPAIQWEGTPDQLGLAAPWESPDMARPLIGQWPLKKATVTLHTARLKVAGSAEVLQKPSGVSPKPPASAPAPLSIKETVPVERVISAGQEIDLLKVTALNAMYRQGPWIEVSDGLRCSALPYSPHKLELPVHPLGEYDLEVAFTCTGPEPSFNLRLPIPGTTHAGDFTIASFGGKAMGIVIHNLVTMELPKPLGHKPSPVVLDQRHTATARVRKLDGGWSIVGLIDGNELVRWQGSPSELTLHEFWRTPDLKRPLVGQWTVPGIGVAIHRAKLKVISGECHLMPQRSRPD